MKDEIGSRASDRLTESFDGNYKSMSCFILNSLLILSPCFLVEIIGSAVFIFQDSFNLLVLKLGAVRNGVQILGNAVQQSAHIQG